jgi:hypothetical protein
VLYDAIRIYNLPINVWHHITHSLNYITQEKKMQTNKNKFKAKIMQL